MSSSNVAKARERQDTLTLAHDRLRAAMYEMGQVPITELRKGSCKTLFDLLIELETVEKLLASALQ